MTDRQSGKYGYTKSFDFDIGSVLFACGGQRDTAFLSIPGAGCMLSPDWPQFVVLGRDQLTGRVTRWGGAVDDFDGKHSVDLAVQMYLDGMFRSGGRQPACNQMGNWLTPDEAGRTFYVGRRQNGKMLRVYEKGKQIGMRDSGWTRWEVEFHNVDRLIPWEVLLNPSPYIAGAYPCMAWVGSERTRIKTVRAEDGIAYDRLTRLASIAYGPLVNVMLEREGSAEMVMAKLQRPGAPRRLAASRHALRILESDG